MQVKLYAYFFSRFSVCHAKLDKVVCDWEILMIFTQNIVVLPSSSDTRT